GYHKNSNSDPTVVKDVSVKDEDMSEDDFLEGELNFGLGCNGRVHVLFERLATAIPLLDLIRQVRHTQQPVTIATLIRSDNSENGALDLQVGSRVYLDTYLKTGSLTDIYLNHNVASDADTVINNVLLEAIKKLSKHQFHKKDAGYVELANDLEL